MTPLYRAGSLKQRKAWNVGTKIILAIVKSSPSSVEVIMKMLSEDEVRSGEPMVLENEVKCDSKKL